MDVLVWRITDGMIIQEFEASATVLHGASFSTDSSYLAITCSCFNFTTQSYVGGVHILTVSHIPTSSSLSVSSTFLEVAKYSDRVSSIYCQWSPDGSMLSAAVRLSSNLCGSNSRLVVQQWDARFHPQYHLLDTATIPLALRLSNPRWMHLPSVAYSSQWLVTVTTGSQYADMLSLTMAALWQTQDTKSASTNRVIHLPSPIIDSPQSSSNSTHFARSLKRLSLEVSGEQATLVLSHENQAWISTIPLVVPTSGSDDYPSDSPQWTRLPLEGSDRICPSFSADHTKLVYTHGLGYPQSSFIACRSVAGGSERVKLASFEHYIPPGNAFDNLALSPDGSLIAVSFLDGAIHLYRMEADTCVLVGSSINKHKTRIRHMKYTPGGDTLCSIDCDGFVCFQTIGHLLSH